jgi:hypothetical protein
VGENIEPDKGFWMARSIMYRGGNGAIDTNNPWLPAAENPRVKAHNCSACEGTCWDRDWSSDGKKCSSEPNQTLAKSIGPCDEGCDCVPPTASYDYLTHGPPACCNWPGKWNCDGKKDPTFDKDRGKDYNHSTFLDLIIEGLIGLRALMSSLLVIQPLADDTIKYFALDNLAYHGHNFTVLWDPAGSKWPSSGCKGLCVFVDGAIKAQSPTLSRLSLNLTTIFSQLE